MGIKTIFTVVTDSEMLKIHFTDFLLKKVSNIVKSVDGSDVFTDYVEELTIHPTRHYTSTLVFALF